MAIGLTHATLDSPTRPATVPGAATVVVKMVMAVTDAQADAKALPSFYAMLSPGGCILLNNYANNIEHYKTALAPNLEKRL